MPRPLVFVDKRRFGEEVTLTETFIIPSTSPYYVRLTEVPQRYINNIQKISSNMKEQSGGTVSSNRFIVDYAMGRIDFNVSDAGLAISITYKGTGSVIWAEDLNNATARRAIPRSLTRAEIIALPDEDKEINEMFYVSDEERMGHWNGTDVVT